MPDLAIGALIALLGVLIAQLVAMLQARLDRQNKREILLRTKYEELGQHFLASTDAPARLLKCKTHEEIEDAVQQLEAKQAQLLALIYFPPLRDPLQRYVSSYQNLCLAVTELYYQRPEGKKVGEVVYNHRHLCEVLTICCTGLAPAALAGEQNVMPQTSPVAR